MCFVKPTYLVPYYIESIAICQVIIVSVGFMI